MVKFRVGWWFKFQGSGSHETVKPLLLNLKDLCKEKIVHKVSTHVDWSPPHLNGLKFNVDGSVRGKPGPTGIGGV